MSVRKEQFQGVLTRWEKERLKKQLMEQQLMEERSWMKPKAQPIEIGSASERQEALSRGCMVFRDGDEVIELPLVRPPRTNLNEVRALQGVYKVPGKGYVVLRTWPKTQWGPDQLELYLLEKFKTTKQTGVGNQRPIVTPVEYWVEKDIGGSRHVASFFYRVDDLGHMVVGDLDYRGHSLSIKAASKTEREQRARHGGSHEFVGLTQFEGVFRKLGYKVEPTDETSPWVNLQFGFAGPREEEFRRYRKAGRPQPFDDMSVYHRIEAIDPKTGKARMFTFTIQNPREIRPGRENARGD